MIKNNQSVVSKEASNLSYLPKKIDDKSIKSDSPDAYKNERKEESGTTPLQI